MKIKVKIEYLLKHNTFIQSTYKIVFNSLFRILGLFVRIDKDLVLLSSYGGRKFNDSPKVLYDALKQEKPFLKFVWAFENPEKFFIDCEKVKIDTPRYFLTALRAKYWITNVNIERGLHFKKKNTIYVNTWHGIPLKLVGNAVDGRNDFDFSNIDTFCCSGKHDRDIYIRDMQVNPKNILNCGMPRNDELYNVSTDRINEIKKKLKLPIDKKVILYAPTWRESTDGGSNYEIKPPINIQKWKEVLSDNYIVIFRMHHFTTKLLGLKFDDFILDGSSYSDINELMIISDILISDYSATIFDYSILERPIISFAYDYDSYIKNRGFYMDIEKELPNGLCRTEDELLSRIVSMDFEKESIKAKLFKDKYIEFGGKASEKIISFLLAR